MLYSLVWEQHIGCLWITFDFITLLNHSPRCSDPNCPILVNDIINQSVAWTKNIGVFLGSLFSHSLEVVNSYLIYHILNLFPSLHLHYYHPSPRQCHL